MRTGLKMTIQDYFKRCGVHGSVSGSDKKANAVKGHAGLSFSHVLDAARSKSNPPSRLGGLGIKDYTANPVIAKRSFLTIAKPSRQAVASTTDVQLHIDSSLRAADPSSISQHVQKTVSEDQEKVGKMDQILASIGEAAEKYKLPAALIRAVVKAESAYQPRAVSAAGAQGLMQLMPATAKELGVQDPFDIEQNIDGGAKYLRNMLDRFNGDVKLALSAYNAGPGTVVRYEGNVPYAETRKYVARVMRFQREFS